MERGNSLLKTLNKLNLDKDKVNQIPKYPQVNI